MLYAESHKVHMRWHQKTLVGIKQSITQQPRRRRQFNLAAPPSARPLWNPNRTRPTTTWCRYRRNTKHEPTANSKPTFTAHTTEHATGPHLVIRSISVHSTHLLYRTVSRATSYGFFRRSEPQHLRTRRLLPSQSAIGSRASDSDQSKEDVGD